MQAFEKRGLLTSAEAKIVSVYRLTRFYLSPIGQRVLASPTVKREWAFNLVRDEQGNMVQGVIDCAFIENSKWVLLDYKTDHLETDEAFEERYGEQLRWYARALWAITGVPVAEAWIYSLHLNRMVSIRLGKTELFHVEQLE